MIKFLAESQIIQDDIRSIVKCSSIPWAKLSGKTVAVSGAAGMLASYVVETLISLGHTRVIALVRDRNKACVRFSRYINEKNLAIREYDCASPINLAEEVNIIIHAASLPRPDVKMPVNVLIPNILGTHYLLEAARKQRNFDGFLFFSSGAIYGEMQGGQCVDEDMGFPVLPTRVKNCYSIGKMSGEALCAAYASQYGIRTLILRYAHTFGPGMDLNHDIRAFAEFMRNALEGRDISLQTSGEQKRSYCYVTDATLALFKILFNGTSGEAYNIVNEKSTLSIREFANLVSQSSGGRVKVIGGGVGADNGYSPQHLAAMISGAKLCALGWQPVVPVLEAVDRTLGAYINV